MDLNLTVDDRAALLSSAERGSGTVFYREYDNKSQLIALDLATPHQYGEALLTDLGIQVRDFLHSQQDSDRLVWEHAQRAVKAVLRPDASGTSHGPVRYSYSIDGSTRGYLPFTNYLRDGTSESGTVAVQLVDGQTSHEITCDPTQTYDADWAQGGSMDNDPDADCRIIVDHVVYYIRPYVAGEGYMRGFGGRRWDVVSLADGSTRTTCNLWQTKTVPPKWRERWPDTARFDWAYVEQERSRLERLLTPRQF